jgi:pilus assembly protein Flp/PilA
MSKIRNWAITKVAAHQARDEEGQGLAEYGLILALVAVACIAVLGLLGGGLVAKITEVVDALA